MLAAYLQRILAWSDARVPGLRASLRPGASSAQLRAVEERIGAELPADVGELFRLHDGQDIRDGAGLIYGLPLMSLDEALGSWASWQDLLETQPGLQEESAELMTSYPPGAVEACYIHRGWFPLTRDGSGNHIGIDLSPGPRGTRGQVITFGRDENEKLQLASSLTDFLGWYAGELERGNAIVEIDEDEDEDGNALPHVIERFTIADPALHFHDAARQLRRSRGLFAP